MDMLIGNFVFAALLGLVTSSSLGCATLKSLSGSVLGTGRMIAVTNALAVPLCAVRATYAGKTLPTGMRENQQPTSVLQNGIRPGQKVYLVLPFDPSEVATFDLSAFACTSDDGKLASDSVVATAKELRSEDIGKLLDEPVVLH